MVLIFKAIFVIVIYMDEIRKLKANRILSSLIDGLLMFILFWAAFIFPLIDAINQGIKGTFNNQMILVLAVFYLLGVLLMIFYLFLTSISFKGATLGMKIVNLNYVNYNGTVPNKTSLFFNSLTIVFGAVLSFGLTVFIDFISILVNQLGRSFHDIFSGMKMVNVYDAF